MKPYSDYSPRRARQIVADVLALLAIAFWILVGVTVGRLVDAIGGLGVSLASAGDDFAGSMSDAAGSVAGVPVLGGGLADAFIGLTSVGATLGDAGRTFETVVHVTAIVLGVVVALGPVLTLVLLWLVPRLRFARRAGWAARQVRSGASLELFALRALITTRIPELEALLPDPAGAWRRGDPEAIRRLAALELEKVGVRPGA